MPAKTLTAFLEIKMGSKESLQCVLKQIGNPMKQDNPFLRFGTQTHFARLVVVPGADTDIVYAGEEPLRSTRGDVCDPDEIDPRPWRLMLNAVFDGTLQEFLQAMIRLSPNLDAIFSHCAGYEGANTLVTYLTNAKHERASQIFYDAFAGETVVSINAKAALRTQIQDLLDQYPDDVDTALEEIFKLDAVEQGMVDQSQRARLVLFGGIAALIAVIVVPVLIGFAINTVLGGVLLLIALAFVSWVLLPALMILGDKSDIDLYGAVTDQIDGLKTETTYQASALTGREDVLVQNQFNLYLTFEGNWLVRQIRLIRMFVLMFVLGQGTLLKKVPGSLANLTTVHFGNWVLIDGGRRLFFITNYDGSWENYISDFINKIYHLLDVQLLNFIGFNREGTRNITAFRRWLRRVQIQSDVFYSGYPLLTVRNTVRDLAINDGFKQLKSDRSDPQRVRDWLKLFDAPTIRAPLDLTPDKRKVLQPQLTRQEWDDIQAFIVYGYARFLHGRYLFLHIDDPTKARQWLSQVIPHVTTVAQWDADEKIYNLDSAINIAFTHAGMGALNLPEITLNTFLREYREGIAPPPKGKESDRDRLHPRSIILGDTGQSSPYDWTVGNPRNPAVHLVLLINAESATVIDEKLAESPFSSIESGSAGVTVLNVEGGATPHTGREPFGFRDGVSNPWIEGTRFSIRHRDGIKGASLKLHDKRIVKEQGEGLPDRVISLEHNPVVRTGEFILGYPNEHGNLPATPLVEQDTQAFLKPINGDSTPEHLTMYKDFGRNGAYIVYRKLSQDVEGFWGAISDYAVQTDDGPDRLEMQKIAAKMVGRWPSGISLVLAPDSDDKALQKLASEQRNVHLFNDFAYRMAEDDDSLGMRCPFASHVRRTQPRDSMIDDSPRESIDNTNLHRLIRRAVSFGKLGDHQLDPAYYDKHGAPLQITHGLASDYPEDPDGVGIHFWAVMTNIAQQFEFIQQAWNNNPRFNGLFNSRDPIASNNPEKGTNTGTEAQAVRYAERGVEAVRNTPSDMVVADEPVRERLANLPRFVHVKGGSYLFMPGINALKYLTHLQD